MKSKTSEEVKMRYQIRVEGGLNSHWTHWFEGMSIESDGATTVITGSVADQSQLHGFLHRIRDLNLTLISVNKLDLDEDKTPTEDETPTDDPGSTETQAPRSSASDHLGPIAQVSRVK